MLGGSCAALSPNSNNVPVVDGGNAVYTTPSKTPFALTATTTSVPDSEETFTYAWEQVDAGSAGYLNPPYTDVGDPQTTTRPIFRPFDPSNLASRMFPSLNYILNNQNLPPLNATAAEYLPQGTRAMNFRVTVRDGNGGVSNDSVRIEVDGDAGPFEVTAPSSAVTWQGGTTQTVTWNVNGTNLAPVSCATVKISILADGGNSFLAVLATGVPNTGSATVNVPFGYTSTSARVKVEAEGNIFFDISDVNFSLTPGCGYSISPLGQRVAAGGATHSVTVTASVGCQWTAVSNNSSWLHISSGASGTGNITVIPAAAGYLTLFPSNSAQPSVANSNFTQGEITNNVLTVGLGTADGAFKIFSSATTQVILDVTGYYAPPGTGGLYFHALPSPVRLLETRAGFSGCIAPGAPLNGTGNPNADPNLDLAVQGRSPVAAPCNSIPATAQVLVGNVTSVLPSGVGYLTIYSSGGARPTVASSNYVGNDVINGPFAVKLGADGKFKVYTFATTHLVMDILGYYSAEATDANGAGLLFSSLPAPVRLLETRPDFPGFPLTGCTHPNAKIQGNPNAATHTQSAGNFCGLSASALAVVGNVTVINSEGAGILTLFPANLMTAPSVATSNYPMPATFGYNRHYFVGLSPTDGKFKVLTQFTTNLILDASGYFAP